MINDQKDILKLKVNYDFGCSKDKVVANFLASKTAVVTYYGMSSSDVSAAYDLCKSNNISPEWLFGYTISENGGAGGWVNHYASDVIGGWKPNLQRDLNWINGKDPAYGSGAYSTGAIRLAWDDPGGGTVGKVPANIQAEGDAYGASLETGTIGRVMLSGTASVAWGFFYPQLLLKVNNGVQNYANGAKVTVDFLNECGASINGSGGGGGDTPTPEPAKREQITLSGRPCYLKNNGLYELGTGLIMIRYQDYFIPIQKKKSGGGGGTPTPTPDPTPAPTDTSAKIKWLDSIVNTVVGYPNTGSYGQCYGLVQAYSDHLGNTHKLIGGINASDIGTDYPWTDWGWKLQLNPSLSDIQPGDIVCVSANKYSPTYGHVVIAGENGTYYDQNKSGNSDPVTHEPNLSHILSYATFTSRIWQ